MRLSRLPFGGGDIRLRDITGADEMLLLESAANDTEQVLFLAERLALTSDGLPIDWQAGSVTNIDAVMLLIRSFEFGDLLRAEAVCPESACATRIDISFSLAEYLRHPMPKTPRGVVRVVDSTWFELRDCGQFRIPTVADQLAVQRNPQPHKALIARCIRPVDLSAAQVRRIERAMDTIAPLLAAQLDGVCPACAARVHLWFDPRQYVLVELRNRALYLYEDVCVLAGAYHWSEAEIVAMPAARRMKYAEITREQRSDA